MKTSFRCGRFWMAPMNRRCVAGILTVSQQTDLRKIGLSREYDTALAAVSWEQRATAAFSLTNKLPPNADFFRFASTDPALNKRKDEAQTALNKLFTKTHIVQLGPSTEFSENAEKIEAWVRDIYEKLGRPIRILVDITCMPKSYLLFLIGMGFSRGYFSRMDCTYAEGNYNLEKANADSASGDVGIISEGEWGALQIPYLDAESSIPAHRDLIVSMGGEIGLSLPFMERYEPHRVSLVLIKESLVQTPDRLPPTEAAALERILAEGNVSRQNISLTDAVSIVEHALAFCKESGVEAISGIVLGSKPHAIALGVAALHSDNLEIICRIPKRYRPLDVAPTGQLAFYEIEDRFEPSGYFTEPLKP